MGILGRFSATSKEKRGIVKTILRFLFSHIGLCLLICGYSALGAYMFYAVEHPAEYELMRDGKDRAQAIENARLDIRRKINEFKACFNEEEAETEALFRSNMALGPLNNFTKTDVLLHMARRSCRNDQIEDKIKALLDEYQRNIAEAIATYGYDGTVPDDIYTNWSFSSALVFTVTTITLIGYGHISPTGKGGQIAVIFYSLIGIPLTLMFLANIGKVFAAAIRFAYGKGCCYFCYRDRKRHEQTYVTDVHGKFSHRLGEAEPAGFKPPTEKVDRAELLRQHNAAAAAAGNSEQIYDVNEQGVADFARGVLDEDDAKDILLDGDQPVPIALTIGIILMYVGAGALMFSVWEGWPKMTALYFSFVTLTTIGFGDKVPGFTDHSSAGQFKLFAASAYIVIGLAVLSMGFDLIIMEILAKARKVGKLAGVVEKVDEDGDGVDDEEQGKRIDFAKGRTGGNIGRAANRMKY